MRYALDVQYIGKNYSGSQIQYEGGQEIDKPTIQGEIEKGICTLLESKTQINNRPIKTIFSGRTDKGVNSLGQVIHFDYDKEIVASKFIYHLNEILPDDISVNNLRIVPESFHAQKSAKARYYRYELINRRYKQAFDDQAQLFFDRYLPDKEEQPLSNYLPHRHKCDYMLRAIPKQ